MIFFIIGGSVLIVGVIIWLQKSKREKKLSIINEFESSTVKMIRENYEFIEGGYGEGNFSNYVEVNGYVSHGEPLIAEFSGIECVYYHAQVIEEYEEEQAYTDQKGKRRYRWVRKSRKIQDIERKIDFDLDDETGLIFIELDGAELSKELVYSDYEQGENPDFNKHLNQNTSSGFLDALLSGLKSRRSGNGTRILGYKYSEEALPLDAKIYVIGEANDRNGELSISAPKEESKPFIISLKSEDQIVKDLEKKIKTYKIGAIACFVLGIGLAIFGVFYTPTTPTNTHDNFYENQEYEYNDIEDFDSEYY